MMIVYPAQANVLRLPIAARADGEPITSGTVNFYLKALDGIFADKWYQGSDETWQTSEAIAGAATNSGDAGWELELPAAVWRANIHYSFYAKESGDLHLPVEIDIICRMRI